MAAGGGGEAAGRLGRFLRLIQGMKKNWMNVNGRSTTRKTVPVRSTTIVNTRPASDANVMSPKPRVDIVTNVQ